MRQRKLGSHTPPCHRRMVITTLFSVFLAALQRRPVLYHTRWLLTVLWLWSSGQVSLGRLGGGGALEGGVQGGAMGWGGSREGRLGGGGSRWGNLGWGGGHKALVVSSGRGGGGGLRVPPLALPLSIPSP